MSTTTVPNTLEMTTPKEAVNNSTAAGKELRVPYLLYYRQGQNPHPLFFVFNFPSTDMKLVAARAKQHCDVMNYRFVYVKPFVVNLDAAEKLRISSEE